MITVQPSNLYFKNLYLLRYIAVGGINLAEVRVLDGKGVGGKAVVMG